MKRILTLLLVASAGLVAADVAIPVAAFGQDIDAFTVEGKPAALADGRVSLPLGAASTVAWSSKEGAGPPQRIFVVDRTTPNQAPPWHAAAGTGFAGSESLQVARQRATLEARKELLRQAAGQAGGTVSGTVSGTQIELVITLAADAADQPPYIVPDGPMRQARQAAADGIPGRPWVRCWARVVAGAVQVDK